MEFPAVNYLAVLAAAVSAFVLGGLWYSPLLFAKKWMAYTGHADCGEGEQPKGNTGADLRRRVPALADRRLCLRHVPAARHRLAERRRAPASRRACAWVATSFGITYLFERRPLGLWLINGGYHMLQFTLYGLVIGAIG